MTTARTRAVGWTVAATIASLGLILIDWRLFLAAAVVIGFAALGVVNADLRDKTTRLITALAERTSERDEARDAFAHEAEQNLALVAECERLHLALTEAQLAAGRTPPALRLVPQQRQSDDALFLELYGNKDGGR